MMSELEQDLRYIERWASRHTAGPIAAHACAIRAAVNRALIDILDGVEDDEAGLSAHKRSEHAECMYERADMERQRISEEGR